MAMTKGKIEANISLGKSSCYYLLTGRCSLELVDGLYVSASVRLPANDLLYCPRLYASMSSREGLKPLTVIPCKCGHAEVASAHQRACIAGKKKLEQEIAPMGDVVKEACGLCGGQVTFEANAGGNRNVTLRVRFRE